MHTLLGCCYWPPKIAIARLRIWPSDHDEKDPSEDMKEESE